MSRRRRPARSREVDRPRWTGPQVRACEHCQGPAPDGPLPFVWTTHLLPAREGERAPRWIFACSDECRAALGVRRHGGVT